MSTNKYAREPAQGRSEPQPPQILSEFSLTVQSRQGADGVEWRAVFRHTGKDETTTPWQERSRFNASWAVIRNKLNEAVGAHYGRPH